MRDFDVQLNFPEESVVEYENSKPYCCGGKLSSGEMLFRWNCTPCHSINLNRDLTGPALEGVLERAPSREWLHAWIRNSAAVSVTRDEYGMMIYEEWNKTQMTAMPHLSDEDIDAILDFIQTGGREAYSL